MSFVEILKVIVLGIVEGFTEWLPISSTGHMILVDEIIHLDVSEAYREVFMVVIQLGAILAVMVLYFNKLNPFSPHKSMAQKRGTIRLWIKIIIACIPAAVIGLPLDHFMDKLMNGYVVAAMLILYGVLFIVLENRNVHRHFPIERVTQISFQTAALIGCFQVLAMIPGTSRSGATILGAMLIGCSRPAAAEFSFFLGSSYFLPVRVFMCCFRRSDLQCSDNYLTCQSERNRSGSYDFWCWFWKLLRRFSFQAGRRCWTDLRCSDRCSF